MELHNLVMIVVFIVGYALITIEHRIGINKTAIALGMAIVMWIIQFLHSDGSIEKKIEFLTDHLSNISQVVFFLLGALAIVETISAHRGFNLITDYIHVRSKRKLLVLLGFLTFFLSAILDNLTTTIIMVTMLRKFLEKGEERLLLGGLIVIAANAGGAWTPIGDVTTTMLWIGGHLTTWAVMRDLFIPSLLCLIVALITIGISLKGEFLSRKGDAHEPIEPFGKTIFLLGIGSLIFVPILKLLTHLPPFMGMMLGLAVVWIFTDIVHSGHKHRDHLKLPYTISKVDISSVLFFLGILLTIDALEAAQILTKAAYWLDQNIGSPHKVAVTLGLISAVVDNVPLVAAIMSMYELTIFPPDSSFWQLVAYCAGTGGSILVIGSAAGVAFMGMEQVHFFWYLRRVGIPAFLGYFAGIGIYELILMLS